MLDVQECKIIIKPGHLASNSTITIWDTRTCKTLEIVILQFFTKCVTFVFLKFPYLQILSEVASHVWGCNFQKEKKIDERGGGLILEIILILII